MALPNSNIKRCYKGVKICPKVKATKSTNILPSLIYAVMKCACCGGDMIIEKDIGNSLLYKCAECGLSDTRVKKNQEKRTDIG